MKAWFNTAWHLVRPLSISALIAVLLIAGSVGAAMAITAPHQQALAEAEAELAVAQADADKRAAEAKAIEDAAQAVEDEKRRIEEEAAREEREAKAAEEAAAAAAEAQAAEERRLAEQAARTWNFANEAGFSYRLAIDVASPAQSHPEDSSFKVGASCGFDATRDIAVPVTLSATATTAGYETPISARFTLNSDNYRYGGDGVAPHRDDDRVRVEQKFSDGTECKTLSSTNLWGYAQPPGIGVSWQSPIAEGRTVQHQLFVIVKDYYLPAHPKGDVALLDFIAIRPLFGGNNQDAANMYRDTDGANLGIYSNRRLTLNGTTLG